MSDHNPVEWTGRIEVHHPVREADVYHLAHVQQSDCVDCEEAA